MSSVLPAFPQLGSQYRNTMLRLTEGRSIRKLMAVACDVQKIFAQGKIKRKNIHAHPVTIKNIHAMA